MDNERKQVLVSMEKVQHTRLTVMSDMLGMSKSSLIKMLLDDKWLRLTDNGMVGAYIMRKKGEEE
jgi:hypothetical protein